MNSSDYTNVLLFSHKGCLKGWRGECALKEKMLRTPLHDLLLKSNCLRWIFWLVCFLLFFQQTLYHYFLVAACPPLSCSPQWWFGRLRQCISHQSIHEGSFAVEQERQSAGTNRWHLGCNQLLLTVVHRLSGVSICPYCDKCTLDCVNSRFLYAKMKRCQWSTLKRYNNFTRLETVIAAIRWLLFCPWTVTDVSCCCCRWGVAVLSWAEVQSIVDAWRCAACQTIEITATKICRTVAVAAESTLYGWQLQ